MYLYNFHTAATLWGKFSVAIHMEATRHMYLKAKSKLLQQGKREFEATKPERGALQGPV